MKSDEFKLSRNKLNDGKKRPACECGTEMTYVVYNGYYDRLFYWICENPKCDLDYNFEPDHQNNGAYR